jgi:hypothetical protein
VKRGMPSDAVAFGLPFNDLVAAEGRVRERNPLYLITVI